MNIELLLRVSLIAYLLAALGYILFSVFNRIVLRVGASLLTIAAFACHSCVLADRMWLARRLPFTNMYETMMFFSWLLVVVTLVVARKYRVQTIGAFTLPVVFLFLAGTSLMPSEISPLMPSLRSNWLLIHVLTCFIAYAAFAVSCAASLFFLLQTAIARVRQKGSETSASSLALLDSLTYRMITLGFPFLTIGIVTGSVWADLSWGTYWSWDPKETWSLVTWLIYAICLHMRYVGNMKNVWAAVASVIGFISVICTYFGVNYLFSSLHAYT